VPNPTHPAVSITTDVGITLNKVTYPNNSIVTNTDIGTGSAALLCTTTYRPCCSSGNPETQWYFPNGSQIPNNPTLPYQRTRRYRSWFFHPAGGVILNHNSESNTTGIFRCDILDSNGVTQSLYVGIYTSTTGECKRWSTSYTTVGTMPMHYKLYNINFRASGLGVL